MTTAASEQQRPCLWQLQISHYNEKVRWALDYKRIPHTRRSMLPGVHRLITKRLAGIVTSPVMTIDGEGIGDSSAILQAIEERWPQPPLIPSDTAQRRRALELEDHFDEELGPHIRRAVYYELLPYPDMVVPLFTEGATGASRALLRRTFPLLRVGMRQAMNIYDEPAARSRDKTIAALDVLEEELGDKQYLVGDSFSIADLTAASLFYPIALPPEFPYPSPRWEDLPDGARDFLGELRERRGAKWVAEMYRRHRLPA
ncbi:MAG TPA: glutathione S-transferase family protein [Thermoleophilaceae bacterium]|jgi:glutathione S-transferase|nr:glutathione S-transferase family protein [Thermoleophilaceae bacterium]